METNDKIPEIDITLTSYTVGGETYPLKLNIRNMFGTNLKGKVELLWIWIRSKELRSKHKTFKEYLDTPVTHTFEMGEMELKELNEDENTYE